MDRTAAALAFALVAISGCLLDASRADAANDPGWAPVTLLDPRAPLEIGHPVGAVGSFDRIPVAALFTGQPELQLFVVDLKAIVPTATAQTIVADGAIFALGPTAENAFDTWGGAYIDGFDLKFWRSRTPHTAVEIRTIDAVDTWIDASSAAAGASFFASGVNFDTGAIEVFYSDTNGAFWTPLRSVQPTVPLYVNFDGGERVSLWVDPDATVPASTRNCVFYETRAGGATTKRLNCADGAIPLVDLPVATDIPSPGLQFDNKIENRYLPGSSGTAIGVFSRRSDLSMNLIRIRDDFSIETVPAGPVSSDPSIFGIGVADRTEPGDTSQRICVLYPDSPTTSAHHRWFPDDVILENFAGPATSQGPVGLARRGDDLFAFFASAADQSGFGVSHSPEPIFADGVNDGTTDAWSLIVFP